MELSTTIPSTRIKAINTTIFMVNPTRGTNINAMTIESGMAMATKRALSIPMPNLRATICSTIRR